MFCLEGRSWRKDYYEPIKETEVMPVALTVAQKEEDEVFWEMFDEFKNFVTEKTNCTVPFQLEADDPFGWASHRQTLVLHHSELEADDLIAGWVQSHYSCKY